VTKVFIGGVVITPLRTFENGCVVIEGREVSAVGPQERVGYPKDAEIIDVRGSYVVPGFIDMHVHGGGGADVGDATLEALATIAQCHARGGTTSFLATTLSAPFDKIERAVKCIQEAKESDLNGAKVLGAHLEGPYFAQAQRGAQNPAYLKKPDFEEMIGLVETCPCIRRVSMAPELPGALPLARELCKRGVQVAIGHSDASYRDVLAAIEAGFTHVTHIYSGMSGLKRINSYRIPGVIESALLLDELTVEMIGDGHHLPPSLIRLIIKCKGLDKVALITDAMAAAGMGPGQYSLGGMDVVVESDVPEQYEVPVQEGSYVAKLLDRKSFAGSVATMEQCVRNVVQLIGLSIRDALKLASWNPAHMLGIERERGAIAPGMKADVVVMDPTFRVRMTMVEGKVVYRSNEEV